MYETSTRKGYDWRDDAACRDHDPETWFPIGETGTGTKLQIKEAIAVCAGCPVIEACEQFAADTNQVEGIWAGRTESERRARKRAAARNRQAAIARGETVGPREYNMTGRNL